MPKISVIVPAFNAMDYLPETIKSVLEQTFTDFEILIINDGSSDNIVEWTTQISDPRVKLISQGNQGLAGARNTGITCSEGDYIAFLDADDLWHPTKLEKQVQYLDLNPGIGVVNTWVINIDEQGKLDSSVCKTNSEGEVWEKLLQENIVLCGSVVMVRRICFEMVGVFDQNLPAAEDWDMWIRIAAQHQFSVLREPLVFYRQHSSSMSSNLNHHLQWRLAVIDKTFTQVPPEFQHLKNKAYGLAYLSSAWKCLQNKDHKNATYVCDKALIYYPEIRFSKSYFRVSMSVFVMRQLGVKGYNRIRGLMRIAKSNIEALKYNRANS